VGKRLVEPYVYTPLPPLELLDRAVRGGLLTPAVLNPSKVALQCPTVEWYETT
jgi:hypothetical protein